MSPVLQVIFAFGLSALIVVGVLVFIALELYEEHEVNEEIRHRPISHH